VPGDPVLQGKSYQCSGFGGGSHTGSPEDVGGSECEFLALFSSVIYQPGDLVVRQSISFSI